MQIYLRQSSFLRIYMRLWEISRMLKKKTEGRTKQKWHFVLKKPRRWKAQNGRLVEGQKSCKCIMSSTRSICEKVSGLCAGYKWRQSCEVKKTQVKNGRTNFLEDLTCKDKLTLVEEISSGVEDVLETLRQIWQPIETHLWANISKSRDDGKGKNAQLIGDQQIKKKKT